MDAKKLIESRKQAEAAVSDMPDGEIKVKAFEVILHHLLSGNTSVSSEPIDSKTPKKHSKESAKEKKTSTSASLSGRVLVLKEEGFFGNPKTIGQVREELQAHGWHYPVTALSGQLMRLVQKRDLRRQKLKEGAKTTWKYTNP